MKILRLPDVVAPPTLLCDHCDAFVHSAADRGPHTWYAATTFLTLKQNFESGAKVEDTQTGAYLRYFYARQERDTQLNERTRRRLLKFVVGMAALPIAGSLLRAASAMAAESRELDEADPAAAALGYKKDTTQVDAAKYPQHQPAQDCGRCRYYQGKAGSESGPCTIFPGKGSVHTKGWCAAYAAK